MDDRPEYFDIRSSFWQSCFEKASEYECYLDQSPASHAKRWHDMAEKMPPLNKEQRQRLGGHHRALNVLLVTGVWCGDCVRQGPMIRQIVDACEDVVRMRLIDRDLDSKLRDELRIIGAMRVPVVVFLTEDFFEVGRFGDQMLTTYRKMAAKDFWDTPPAKYSAPQDEFVSELSEWVDIFERILLMVRLSPLLRTRHGD